MGIFRAYFTNGEMTKVNFNYISGDDENLDALLEALYEASGSSLCHHCAERFDIGEGGQIYCVTDDAGNEIYRVPTPEEMTQKFLDRERAESTKLRTELNEYRQKDGKQPV